MADALAFRISFGERDVTYVDWNTALVFDVEADEARAVLEFANVQLLEMRFLDQELDEDLEQSYQLLSSRGLTGWRPFNSPKHMLHVSTLQADAAVLYERVANALKLVGDMYLARLYRMVARRFHLEEWDNSITRKLQTIEGIYQKLAHRQENRRLETLEWIVIILIAVEIGLTLVH